jgi:hypothetical protein
MFLGGTDSGTGGVGGAGSLLLVLFVFPDIKITAATCSTEDSVTGALVRCSKRSESFPNGMDIGIYMVQVMGNPVVPSGKF